MNRKIILIDGNSLVYRAFYALPTTLTLPSGQPTNAVYGFTSMLIRLLIDEQPDAVAVAFDSAGPTWRHGHYAEYKAHRDATPDELISQFPLVKEVLSALAIPIFELAGFEADDILATLTKQARTGNDEVLVVTGDRDAFQLISDGKVRVMTTRRGITDIVVYGREKVIERYGVAPEQVPDFLGLKGDPSDNIPGVPGVGEKTAARLIDQFGNLENLYEQLDAVGSDKLRSTLIEFREQAKISKELAVLNQEVPVEADLSETVLGSWDEAMIREVFSRLEFRTLLERFEAKLAPSPATVLPLFEVETVLVDEAGLSAWLQANNDAAVVGLDLLSDAGDPVGLTLGLAGKDRYTAVAVNFSDLSATASAALSDWLAREKRRLSVYDLKTKINAARAFSAALRKTCFDPLLAAYLLSPQELNYEFSHLCHRYLEKQLPSEGTFADLAGARAAAAAALYEPVLSALNESGLDSVLFDIEVPLSMVLADMESCGVGIDKDFLAELGRELEENLNTVAGHIYALAGEEFNINSPQQVGVVLFDKLGLKPLKKTKGKTAYATDANVLNKLRGSHEIVGLILEHREIAKLKSTYVDALAKLIDPKTGRLHTSFNQTVTATGRLSSSNPNLQNIPTRTELGRRIRKAFIPPHRDDKLLTADYSQIELRLLAELSNDAALKQAFKSGLDIHTATAAEVFGLRPEKVTGFMRRNAKAINFGIIYGMSPFGLSEQLGIAPEEARDYIELYFQRYPAVRDYLDRCIKDAYKFGYAVTVTGRRRYIPELNSANYNERSFGERVATNAPLQGSAADIIKIAMINIDRYLRESGLQTRMVLQVHDELVFEVPPLEETVAQSEVKRLMEAAYPLSIPLEVNIGLGSNWGTAK